MVLSIHQAHNWSTDQWEAYVVGDGFKELATFTAPTLEEAEMQAAVALTVMAGDPPIKLVRNYKWREIWSNEAEAPVGVERVIDYYTAKVKGRVLRHVHNDCTIGEIRHWAANETMARALFAADMTNEKFDHDSLTLFLS